jgi:hypothetical protein
MPSPTTPRRGDLLWSRVALKPSQVIKKSNLSPTVFFLISLPVCEKFLQVGVSHGLTQMITIKLRVSEREEHTQSATQQHTQESERNECNKLCQ